MSDKSPSDRFKRGSEYLKKIHGEVGENVMDSLQDIAPDLSKFITEYGFGDIYSRPGLELRERQIATIAALTVIGDTKVQLKVHIKAGLNVGLSREEIIEIIMQMSLYGGFPRTLNGITAAKEAFAELDS